MAKRSTGWLAGWLVGWLAGWLPGWLAGPPLPEPSKKSVFETLPGAFRGQGLIFDLPNLNLSLQA